MDFSIVTELHDFLRPWMWHDPQGVEIDGNHIRLTAKHRAHPDGRTAAGATVKLSGCRSGIYRFEAKMPRAYGIGSAAWLINGFHEFDIFEANTNRLGSYMRPRLNTCYNVFFNFWEATWIDKNTVIRNQLGPTYMKMKKPTDWQAFSFLLTTEGFEVRTEKRFYEYTPPNFSYKNEYLDLIFSLWPQEKAANNFSPGTFEIRNFEYTPYLL